MIGYTLLDWLNNAHTLVFLKLFVSFLFALIIGSIYLVSVRGNENLTEWDCNKVYYYTFLYMFIGGHIIYGAIAMFFPLIILLFLGKDTKAIWTILVPVISLIALYITEDKYHLWANDLKFLHTVARILVDYYCF